MPRSGIPIASPPGRPVLRGPHSPQWPLRWVLTKKKKKKTNPKTKKNQTKHKKVCVFSGTFREKWNNRSSLRRLTSI